ncbi:hypothetical protein B7494_g4616 [Chlorociboria aeruginascens]|nr:hypothetical protein B7494_g4616 [Chlorociboria aeruginascens]
MVDLIEAVLRALPSLKRRNEESSVDGENRVMDSVKGLDGTESDNTLKSELPIRKPIKRIKGGHGTQGDNTPKTVLPIRTRIKREDECMDEGNCMDGVILEHSKTLHYASDFENSNGIKVEDALEVVDNTKAIDNIKVENDTKIYGPMKVEVNDSSDFDAFEHAIEFGGNSRIENTREEKSPGSKPALNIPPATSKHVEYHPKGTPEPPGIYCVMTSNITMPKSLRKIPQAQPAVHLLKNVPPRKTIKDGDVFVTNIANHTCSIPASKDGYPNFTVEPPISFPGVDMDMESEISIRMYEIAPHTEIKLHRTTATDYIIIQKGFICYLTPKDATNCELDDIPLAGTFFYEGDVLVQRSTMHGPLNPSTPHVFSLPRHRSDGPHRMSSSLDPYLVEGGGDGGGDDDDVDKNTSQLRKVRGRALPTLRMHHSDKHLALHLQSLVAMSTMFSPHHSGSISHPLMPIRGADGASDITPRQLYLSPVIREHFQRVYDRIRGKEQRLTRGQFASWLDTSQAQQVNLDKETYKFEDFLHTVFYNRAVEISKAIDPQKKDLTKPISNYYISSSHNTYLSGNQLSSKSSIEPYKNVLLRGCRCVEIDVHNGEILEPKCTDGSPAPSPKFEQHKRHISTGILTSRAAAEAVEKMEEAYGRGKIMIAEKTGLTKDSKTEDKIPPTDMLSAASMGNALERPPSSRSMRVGEPIVFHGWTLTAPVGFRAVCQAIAKYAFVNSKLPIIISLEVHTDAEQQETMVKIMKEEWKGLLLDETNRPCDPKERLPRLEELLCKILVKVKKVPEKVQKVESSAASTNSLVPVPSRDGDSGQSGSEDERSNSGKKSRKTFKICESLSNMGVYTHSEHFDKKKFMNADVSDTPTHIYSVEENDLLDLCQTRHAEMFAHNRDFFMRAYPAGLRFTSSNLDPSIFWRQGFQMAALNWQTLDEGMMLNEGMFAGEDGWILKPPGYRSADPATNLSDTIQYKTLDLKITIYAGQRIPLPTHQTERGFHPYIKCELHVEKDERASEGKEGEYKMKSPSSKGDHPYWGNDGFQLDFMGIGKVVEELSFVRFKIEDEKYVKSELAAWACIRLDRLQQGYRFVNLYDVKGCITAGLLLVKIEKTFR